MKETTYTWKTTILKEIKRLLQGNYIKIDGEWREICSVHVAKSVHQHYVVTYFDGMGSTKIFDFDYDNEIEIKISEQDSEIEHPYFR